ncbi:hypothetical protein BGZ51_008808 [Haplosporangium sp. Z 767]|nr:hypothetical protein BGZ50_008990 [Haplosporangium sp. Z 11]KAF9177402.1 hypothetical protein BGZ51_008808 [Haplosporangium sp. Z 767]
MKRRRQAVYPALYVPEVLFHILSFLSHGHLLSGPICVSKLWHGVSLRLVRFINDWDAAFCHEKQDEFESRLNNTQILRCNFSSTNNVCDTAALEKSFRAMTVPQCQQLRTIIVKHGLHDGEKLWQLFEPLDHLTHIQLHGETLSPLPLDLIFAQFPKLESLRLDQGASEIKSPSTASLIQNSSEPWGIPKTCLRSLHILHSTVDLALLSDLFTISPNLMDLQLLGIRRTIKPGDVRVEPFNGQEFFSALSRTCPKIQSLAFSESNAALEDEHWEAIVQHFPKLACWTVLTDPWRHRNYTGLFASRDNDNALMLNHLTTLEIQSPLGHIFPTRVLINYLYNAPQLIHLKARSCIMWDSDFDTTVAPLEGSIYSHTGVWACRGLQTLHISVNGGRPEGFSSTADSFEKSRMVFAYIAKVFPQLRDLCLWKTNLRLELASGLCLLSELKDLERLVIQSTHPEITPDQDLKWIARVRKPRKLSKLRQLWKRHGYSKLTGHRKTSRTDVTLNGLEKPVQQSPSNSAETRQLMDEIEQARRPEGVAKVLSELEERLLSTVKSQVLQYACWPRLEQLLLPPVKNEHIIKLRRELAFQPQHTDQQ